MSRKMKAIDHYWARVDAIDILMHAAVALEQDQDRVLRLRILENAIEYLLTGSIASPRSTKSLWGGRKPKRKK